MVSRLLPSIRCNSISARATNDGTCWGDNISDICNNSIFVAIFASSPCPGADSSPGPSPGPCAWPSPCPCDCCMAISYKIADSKSGGTCTPHPLASESFQPVDTGD